MQDSCTDQQSARRSQQVKKVRQEVIRFVAGMVSSVVDEDAKLFKNSEDCDIRFLPPVLDTFCGLTGCEGRPIFKLLLKGSLALLSVRFSAFLAHFEGRFEALTFAITVSH